MNWIKTLVADNNGDPSTMRVATLLVIIAVLGNWVFLTVHTGQQQPLVWQQVGLVLGSLTAKTVQAGIETKTTTPAASTTPTVVVPPTTK